MEKEGHENLRAELMRDDVYATQIKKTKAKIGGVCEKRAKLVDELLSKSADRVPGREEAGPVVHAPMAQVHVQPGVLNPQGQSFIQARTSSLGKTVPKHAAQDQPTSCPYTEKGCLDRGNPSCPIHLRRSRTRSGGVITCPPLSSCQTCGGDQEKCASILRALGVE